MNVESSSGGQVLKECILSFLIKRWSEFNKEMEQSDSILRYSLFDILQFAVQSRLGHRNGRFDRNGDINMRSLIQGVRLENARAGLKPDTRHLKPMLAEGFIAPDYIQKKRYFVSKLQNLSVRKGIDNLQ